MMSGSGLAAVNRTIRGFDYQLSGPLIKADFFCVNGFWKMEEKVQKTVGTFSANRGKFSLLRRKKDGEIFYLLQNL